MDDYLAVEPMIVARLEDQLADVTVKSTWGMPKIPESFDLPPAVLIFLEDDRPGPESDRSQKVEQVWLCLVVVNDPGNEAGSLIAQVIKTMSGWTPDRITFAPFKRVKSTFSPDTSPNGVYYFPLAFSTSFVFNT